MKKQYLLPAVLLAITLTGCSLSGQPTGGDNAGDAATDSTSSAEEVQQSTESSSTAQEDKSAEAASDTGENAADPIYLKSTLPIYKVVTKYYNEFYKGKYTKDKEGNSLENKSLFQGNYEALMVAESSKNSYPALYKTLNDKADERLKASEAEAKDYTQSATEQLEDTIDSDFPFTGSYYSNSSVSITRADENVLSSYNYFESYTGGAHGIYGLTGESYDVSTGTELKLSDVLSLTETELNPILKDKILASVESPDELWDLDETLSHYRYSPKETSPDNYENSEYSYNWYLDQEGIHFYFGPYEIAAYAYGATDIVIPYDELKGKFNEKYLPEEDRGYICQIHLPIYPTASDDDKSDLHLVYEPYDETAESEYVTCKSLALKVKDKSAKVAIDFDYNYSINPISSYKVVTKDGREYIYVSVLTYSDYTQFIVFEVSEKGVKLVGQEYYHMIYIDDKNNPGEVALTDPENMYFGQIGNKLGTYTCYGRYIVSPNGMPMLADTSYAISWISDDIKSVKDIPVTRIDAEGYESEDMVIPEGTHITPIRTDNKTYIDCKLDDGSYIRLKFSGDDYPPTINGEKVDDLFEGLLYAG